MTKPQSGKIEDSKFTSSSGSDHIKITAQKCTPVKPLLIFIGGPATTVAAAYLADTTIADKIIVISLSDEYNGMDSWSMYILSKKVRYIQVPHIGETKIYIKNWAKYDRTNQLPDNEATRFIKAIDADNKWRTTPANGIGILFMMAGGIASNADRIFVENPPIQGYKVTSTHYDILKLDNYIDYQAAGEEFYRVMLNSKAWGKVGVHPREKRK